MSGDTRSSHARAATLARREEAVRLYREGLTIQQVGAHLTPPVCPATAFLILRNANEPRRRKADYFRRVA